MISMSSYTPFINNGDRFNEGRLGQRGLYEPTGVYIGCVGARFEKPGVMEHKFLVKPAQVDAHAQQDTQVDAMYRNFFKGVGGLGLKRWL